MNEHRKELQTNELAAYLQKINRSIEPYSKQIAVVVGVVIVGGIAWGLYSSKVSGDRSDATIELIQAVGSSNAEQLARVSETYPDTPAASWSRLYEGNAHLAGGLQILYFDRDEATLKLEDARAAFEEALSGVGSEDSLLRSRANFGIGRVAETLGEIDEAIEAYRNCIQANESEAMVEQAQNRIDTLSKTETKEFLVWFSEQNFKPADPSLPPSLPAEKTLPDIPDFKLPTLGDKLGGGEDPEGKKLEGKDGLDLPDDDAMEDSKDAKQSDSEAAESDESSSAPATDAKKSADDEAAGVDEPSKDASDPEPEAGSGSAGSGSAGSDAAGSDAGDGDSLELKDPKSADDSDADQP